MVRPNYAKDAASTPGAKRLRQELAGVLEPKKPRWKSEYKGPDPDRQKIDGKAVVSREELADFQRQYGAAKTLRDLLNADATGKLPARVGAGAGRGAAEGRKATDRDTAPMRSESPYNDPSRAKEGAAARRREMMRDPGRDAIEPMLGPETGLAALGRAGAGALMRGLAGAFGRRAAPKAADDLVEPVGDLTPQGRVFRSARPDAEAAKQAEYMKKGGSTKSYAKGGSVRGAGCETRTKKTRYV
jgi:hypothetical protein